MKHIACRSLCGLLMTCSLFSSAGFANALHTATGTAAAVQGPAGANWKRYQFAADNFSAEFPAEPQSKPNDGNTGTRYFTSLENDSLAYFVERAQLPEDLNKTPEQVFAGYVDGAAKGTGSQVKSQKDISLHGYPGKEFVLESDALVMKFRLYLSGKTLYQVLVVASKSAESRSETDRFLNSFQFLK